MKWILISMLFSSSVMAETLMECVPKSEVVNIEEQSHYIAYSLERDPGDENFVTLKKTFLSNDEESSVHRRMFKAAFDWREGKTPDKFTLAYTMPGSTFVIKGTIRPGGQLQAKFKHVDSRVISMFDGEKSPVGTALSSKEGIAAWSCLANVPVLSSFKREAPKSGPIAP